jgi:membrane protein YdbS with pleckstrin-like domain
VNELFAPPGNEWQSVSPQLRRMRRLVTVVLCALGLGLLVVVGLLLGWSWWLGLGALAIVAVGVHSWFLIARQVRLWGYAERDEDLYIRHGAFFRELVAVPYGRMQYVDITAGPLEQAYGVATVQLHTASTRTSARIPGLTKEEASRLRDRLTALGEAQAAGL